jgi:hypothetical protein
MGRFERSDRGGGQADPQEALRRAREAVARERAEREEGHEPPDRGETDRGENELGPVRDALREHDEHSEGA